MSILRIATLELFNILCFFLLAFSFAHAQIPNAAKPYQRELTRNARIVWGLDAPIALFATQIHQESYWRADVSSRYADGLAQFTPDTANWIADIYPDELSGADVFNASWSIRALVRYDKHIYKRIKAACECERVAFMLAAYNGGPGWINRDKRLAKKNGADPLFWFGHVEYYSNRADWAFKENRDYPQKILFKHQPLYLRWGRGICL